jgi:NADH-quinone oxidoreductase subunit C
MNETILTKLKGWKPDALVSSAEFRGQLTVVVRKDDIVEACRFVKSDPDLAFEMVVDITGVDWYRPEGRFEVVYHLYSIVNKCYLRLKVLVDEENPSVPSVTGIWPGANWHERETYDMFGITFTGHPDLRRMYMPEDFEYHPLRKDFPVMGIPDSLPLPRR